MHFHYLLIIIILIAVFVIVKPDPNQNYDNIRSSQAEGVLRQMGYQFNNQGKLRRIDLTTNQLTNEPFKYKVSQNDAYNKWRYGVFGKVITKYVYQMLQNMGLHRIYVPYNIPAQYSNFVFCTQPNLNNITRLVVLIHGSGNVRAGQWAQSLIIYDSLYHGTMVLYIQQAISMGYDVLILNTNNNSYTNAYGTESKIYGSASGEQHGYVVWEQLIVPAPRLREVVVVAHSYGGVVTVNLMHWFPQFFKRKCSAICFTDSVHTTSGLSSDMISLLKRIGRNWVKSPAHLNKWLETPRNDAPKFSAGHTKHEWTSYTSIAPLFAFVQKKSIHFYRGY